MIEVKAIVCPKCKDTIFSRARHDFRYCSCQSTAIDGGFDYRKVSFNPDIEPPESVILSLDTSVRELYEDWRSGNDKFGVIKHVEVEH
jgi:hypothetical protein